MVLDLKLQRSTNDLMPQTLSSVRSGSVAWFIFSLSASDVGMAQAAFDMNCAGRTPNYAEEHETPIQLPSRSLTLLAQEDRRAPGFEVVQVARPPARTTSETPIQATAKPSTSKPSEAVTSLPSPSGVETEKVQPASRIPTMVVPSTQPTTVGSAPSVPLEVKATAASTVGAQIEVAVDSGPPTSHLVAERRVEPLLSIEPKPFTGVWYKRSPADCHNRTDDPNDVPLRFTSNSLKFYEAKCSVRSAFLKGSTYTLSTDCVSEGEASSSTTTIKMLNADTFIIDAYEPAGIRGSTYHRCGTKAQRPASADSTSQGPKSAPPAKVSKNGCMGTFIRDTCRPDQPNGCSLPIKAGFRYLMVSQSYENGKMTYSGYRDRDYAASDVRLDPGCKLPQD
jgi:hypothetical protein